MYKNLTTNQEWVGGNNKAENAHKKPNISGILVEYYNIDQAYHYICGNMVYSKIN